MFPFSSAARALVLLGLLSLLTSRTALGQILVPQQVTWGIPDSLATCPAGDTVLAATGLHPSRLRVTVRYLNNSFQPRVGVPPESIWVVKAGSTGNVTINDQAASIWADDSTNATGNTRITVPSLSGCGTLTLRLFISGVDLGTKTVTVRSVDTDADGRVTTADQTGAAWFWHTASAVYFWNSTAFELIGERRDGDKGDRDGDGKDERKTDVGSRSHGSLLENAAAQCPARHAGAADEPDLRRAPAGVLWLEPSVLEPQRAMALLHYP